MHNDVGAEALNTEPMHALLREAIPLWGSSCSISCKSQVYRSGHALLRAPQVFDPKLSPSEILAR